MSSFGSQIRKRMAELQRAGRDVPKILAEVAGGATIEAVRVAVENTPPNGNSAISGTNTRSGNMAQHWATDSVTTPLRSGGSVTTELNNNMQYASYVNDGHRVDEHFVPDLLLDGNTLSMDPGNPNAGLMVGTKTTYVKGLYMKEKAIGKYRSTVRRELDKRVKEAFQ